MAQAASNRCEFMPLPDRRVAFRIDGRDVTCWNGSASAPRPFFFPLIGPGGTEVTRMGHPGAPNHDHHRSVWFAHHKVVGIDFWSDQTEAVIRQTRWLALDDGQGEGRFGFDLQWLDGHDPRPLMNQRLLGAVIPDDREEWFLELQAEWSPTSEFLELGKTHFGMLAVRVARGISATFGGGELTDSEGRRGERAIFGNRARWMDYSGSVRSLAANKPRRVGITVMDHPSNPTHPCHWHVRSDGWMGASLCYAEPVRLERAMPLRLRYLLWIHDGGCDAERIDERFAAFASRPGFKLESRPGLHRQFGVARIS